MSFKNKNFIKIFENFPSNFAQNWPPSIQNKLKYTLFVISTFPPPASVIMIRNFFLFVLTFKLSPCNKFWIFYTFPFCDLIYVVLSIIWFYRWFAMKCFLNAKLKSLFERESNFYCFKFEYHSEFWCFFVLFKL